MVSVLLDKDGYRAIVPEEVLEKYKIKPVRRGSHYFVTMSTEEYDRIMEEKTILSGGTCITQHLHVRLREK
jgi:hypothetical protein